MKAISLEAAIACGGASKRTWWRRMSETRGLRAGTDSRGRALLSLEQAREALGLPDDPDTVELLVAADQGDTEAQSELALIFAEAGRDDVAVYWWRLAAEQGHPDAMQHLGRCYAEGAGVERSEEMGIMWIAKAAMKSQPIARAQIRSMRPF